MARLTRRAFRRRTSLSKYESALEAAYKEKDVVTVGDVASITLTSIPDLIIVPDLTANCAIDIVVPAASPIEANRVVKVVNQDAAQTVTVSVNGGDASDVVAAASSADLYIADSTAATKPVTL
jgi:hypothetical protein